MKKKVFIVSASPRKNGNSELLCEQFAKGATEAGHEIETIRLHDKSIHFCIACDVCKQSGVCFQQDDMKDIIQKLIQADVIVLSTPVYFYSMAAQLKTMIDRTLPQYLDIKNKDFYFIATAADGKANIERTIDSMRGFTDCLPKAKVKGVIYGDHAWKIGEILDNTAMRDALQLGKNC